MRRGLAAAKQQEWPLAIKYFTEAREKAPQAAPLLFNLGFAHDRLGGRELQTIAWYRAFLAAAPGAKNASAIRERIFELEVKTEATSAKLIAQAKRAAAELPDEFDRNYRLREVIAAQARTGDIEGALAAAGSMEDGDDAYVSIAKTQAKNGDVSGAMSTTHRIDSDSSKMAAYDGIATAKAENGDFPGALETASQIAALSDEPQGWYALQYEAGAYVDIAEKMIEAKHIKSAQETLGKALYLAVAISDKDDYGPQYKADIRGEVVEALIAAGDLKQAWEVAALIPAAETNDVNVAYHELTKALAESGQIDAARQAVAKITGTDFYRTNAEEAVRDADSKIAYEKLKAGDIGGAEAIAAAMKKSYEKSSLYQSIAGAKLEAGDIKGAEVIAVKMEDSSSKSSLYDSISDARRKAGDFSAAIAAASKMSDLDDRADTLLDIAAAQIEAKKPDAARKTLSLAAQGLSGVDRSEEYGYQYPMYKIALKWLELKDMQTAMKTADQIPAGEHKSDVYDNIVQVLAEKGDVAGALKLMPHVTEPYDRGYAYNYIALA